MPVQKNPLGRNRKKPVACHRCHTHKVKCSGDQPCTRCRQAGCGDECQYTLRDRKLKVNESYINQILSENSQLKEQLRNPYTPNPSPASTSDTVVLPPESYPSLQNPLLGERAWFYPYDSSAPPIYMGEAACTAFATRLRQFLTQDPNTAHVARTQYTPESSLLEGEAQWPGLAQARLLVKIAFNQLSRVYHLFLRKSTLEQLENVYRLPSLRDDPALTCKFFSLFALGEVYSRSISSPGSRVPGTRYYVRAMGLIPILPERPGMIHLESLLLLSLYSYFLNRRHSAYMLIGSAMRLGLILGLNHNIPTRQCTDPIEREHRVRLWWAIYIFDRMYTSKIGFPLQIRDDDIHVDLPTDVTAPGAEEQFSDTAYLVCSIRLARIIGQIIEKIYSRRPHQESFLQREQQLLLALQDWVQSLPAHTKLPVEGSPPKHVVSLHLQFNQCVILATRPILLHALFQQRAQRENHEDTPQAVITLSEACIHAARHSHVLIIEEWVNGSLPMYGYFYAQYLFASAIILVMSGLLPSIGTAADLESLETAIEILHRMRDHGNLAAAEFYENLKRVKQCLRSCSGSIGMHHDARRFTQEKSHHVVGDATHLDQALDPSSITPIPVPGLTTEMAFLEPTMQDFLGRTDNEIDFVHPDVFLIEESTGIDAWPTTFWTS
ncbi:Zn(II)2Cys6 transcription factor [Aspergillus alliaceus]|uniref:Zn(II)2Cys6 transcription factor n=1 Tax=Petromyces alliaceus TaxID=209559 RepID=UPI0012A48D36|nr:fungal-specific transcription factor domain-containing protein [Aspergillus alliaceus]KAB8238059.1 fungal-specific transcription factor domain-containing protein [Aspergillus alliaceus]